MKQQGKQTKRGTSQRAPAAPSLPKPDDTKPGVAKPGQQDDFGQGAQDFHQSNHGKRGR
jgi:hypothetical protein